MFILNKSTLAVGLTALTLLGGCENGFDLGRLSGVFNHKGETLPSINRPPADSRGVITYDTYQVIVARDGDNLEAMANRVGISTDKLAEANGLPTTYTPRTGEVLVLPDNVGGEVVASPTGWSEEIAVSAIENAGGSAGVGNPTEPLRHRVESGETAYTIARSYNVSVTALATWNGLGPDLAVRPNQLLIIPVPDTANIPAAPVAAPVSEPQPVSEGETPAVAPTPPPAVAPSAPFIAPVEGTIARGYRPNGRNKNEGLDFATGAGATVSAAGDGTVALVSDSLGDLGTIVLIRHSNDLMTVYGRVTNVSVAKGDHVTQGQSIGIVAPAETPIMHFEVRIGTESVDPTQYLR